MGVRRLRASGGLSTDPSALDQPEALRTADNVLLHRPGVIQPRPGFGDVTAVSDGTTRIAARSTAYRPIALVPFGGELLVQSLDTALTPDGYRLERGEADAQYTGDTTPPDLALRGVSDFAEARGSLYLTTATAVKKLTAPDAAALQAAGKATDYYTQGTLFDGASFFVILGHLGTADRCAVEANSAVAYRYCWRSEDANGYVRRSAPSPRIVVQARVDPYIVVWPRWALPEGAAAGDVLEIYRTVNATPQTADPGDECFLAQEYTVTSADVTAGYIERASITDARVDDELAAALYTNASQQGILASNNRPPLANSLANWRRCMWFAGSQEPYSITVEPLSVFRETQPEYARTGFHISANRGSFTATSDTITAVERSNGGYAASVLGVKVGQYISGATPADWSEVTWLSPATKVTAVRSTLTVANHANLTTAPTADYIEFVGLSGDYSNASPNQWRRVTWHATLTEAGKAAIGANANEAAANLASAINLTFNATVNARTEGRPSISATANGATVTIVDATGHGVDTTITETAAAVTHSYQIVVDKPVLETGTKAFYLHDYITVDGVEFYASTGYGLSLSIDPGEQRIVVPLLASGATPKEDCQALVQAISLGLQVHLQSGATPPDVRPICDSVPYPIDAGGAYVLASYGPTELTIQRPDPGDTSFTITAPVREGAFRITSAGLNEERPARLWHSKADEPEAVPPVNYLEIGLADRAILALTPLRDALLVWKEDGLFTVTGDAPASWVVTEVDTTVRLLASRCVCTLDDVAYAWTDRGVVRVTEGGVSEIVSAPIAGTLREYQRLLTLGESGHKRGFWMTAHRRFGLVILSVGASTAAEASEAQYVYHVGTQRWARWTRTDRCGAYDPAEDRMALAPSVSGWQVLLERSDEDAAASYRDATLIDITAASIVDTLLMVTAATMAPWTPAVGDVVYVSAGDGVAYRRVTAVSYTPINTLYTLTLDGVASGTTFSWYQGFASTLEWQAQHLPGMGSRWEEIHAALLADDSAYVSTWPLAIGGTPGGSGTASTVTATITPDASHSRRVRVGPSRAIVRAYDLYPRLAVTCAGIRWALAEMHLHATQQSRRVAR